MDAHAEIAASGPKGDTRLAVRLRCGQSKQSFFLDDSELRTEPLRMDDGVRLEDRATVATRLKEERIRITIGINVETGCALRKALSWLELHALKKTKDQPRRGIPEHFLWNSQ